MSAKTVSRREVFGVMGIMIFVIIGMFFYGLHLQRENNRLSDENAKLVDALELSRAGLDFAIMLLEEQIYVTHGILQFGYAFGTLNALGCAAPNPELTRTIPYELPADPTPPGSAIVYTGKGFDRSPEFKFINPEDVKPTDRVVTVDEMRAMYKAWTKGF